MNCRHARALIHELLDGALSDRAPLDAHLAGCPSCRGFLSDLSRLDGALRTSLACPVDEARLARLTETAIASAERRSVPASPARWLAPVGAVAVLLVVFAAGLLAGRALWPREIVTTRAVYVPRPVETAAEQPAAAPVQMPVQAPVVKEVPVVRTRTVYRDRPVMAPHPAPTEPTIVFAQGPPVKADEIVVNLPPATFTSPTVSTELHPARTVEPEPPAEEPKAPRGGAIPDATHRRIVQAPTFVAYGPPR